MTDINMSAEEWLEYGYKKGFCGPPVCAMHDGLPASESEAWALDENDDPCIHVLRLYEDLDVKSSVEKEHSPSVWRASNRGWTTPQEAD
jgi:hypothetical protein